VQKSTLHFIFPPSHAIEKAMVSGDFEAHFTLGCRDETEIEHLHAWATAHALKFTHIVLDSGATPSQVMLTEEQTGDFPTVFSGFCATQTTLSQAGFVVSRLKVEAAPWSVGIPQSNREARQYPDPCCYFEHHIKLLLDSQADIAALKILLETHHAHLSYNARRTRTDGKHERFVTQRCHGIGQYEAKERINFLKHFVQQAGYVLLETEEEFVTYDSNIGLDTGWMTEQENVCE
jgi:hypothetical protein